MNKIATFRKCTLTDKELIEKVDKLTDSFYDRNNMKRNDGVLLRHIPARPNDDYDLLIGELLIRFGEKISEEKECETCGKKFIPVDKVNYHCQECQPCKPLDESEEENKMMNKVVRKNMMNNKNYSPYCGDYECSLGMPRTKFDKTINQFRCSCGWTSQFPKDFINKYLEKHYGTI